MSKDWQNAPQPPFRAGPLGGLRLLWRGVLMVLVTYSGLILLLLTRAVEWPVFGTARPLTPYITQGVCRANCAILGLRLDIRGTPMVETGAIVANHSSWLDILTLNACTRVYFVSKSEVSGWFGIGWLARATGTLFINRRGVEAKVQQAMLEDRLRQNHRLLFFPEGTSNDAVHVLPFKSSLFQAFFAPGLEHAIRIQPVTAIYRAPADQDPRFYGWWGEMAFAGHLKRMLMAKRHGRVEVIFHPAVPVDGFEDRKALAAYCENVIRTAHPLAEN